MMKSCGILMKDFVFKDFLSSSLCLRASFTDGLYIDGNYHYILKLVSSKLKLYQVINAI